jgi:hypothetical protein
MLRADMIQGPLQIADVLLGSLSATALKEPSWIAG